MAASINASTTAGVVTTADTSGILQLQTAGTTAVTVSASQNVTLAGTLTTTGVTTVQAGSAASPAITTTGDTNTGIFFPAADTIGFSEGGVECARFDSSGNLGLGVTPSAWSSTFKGFQLGSTGSIWAIASGNGGTYYGNNYIYGASGRTYLTTGTAVELAMASGQFDFGIAASGTAGNPVSFTSAMTLDASGNLLVGTTSALGGKISVSFDGSAANGVRCKTTYASNGSQFVDFLNSAGTQIGYISQTGTTTVAYTSVSDYRLKNNVQPLTGALAKVALLKPVTYKWKIDGSDGQGFIAHELQEVVKDCVSGEKDAVYADGNPKYQGVDTSFLVATLTAAIQEQQALITQLQADVAALKGATA